MDVETVNYNALGTFVGDMHFFGEKHEGQNIENMLRQIDDAMELCICTAPQGRAPTIGGISREIRNPQRRGFGRIMSVCIPTINAAFPVMSSPRRRMIIGFPQTL